MRHHLLCSILTVAVLLSAAAEAQALVPIEISFVNDPVQVQTGTEALFTLVNVDRAFIIKWDYQGGVNLGAWTQSQTSVNTPPQFAGRVTIGAATLSIGAVALRDAGRYTVEVDPVANFGLTENSKSVTLNVFDAVTGVNLFVPSVSVEGKNVSLTCSHQTGTDVTFLWTKDGTTLASSARVTITGGSLVISPAQRGDAGDYSCTVSNPVSAHAATQTLIVYYGPDTPVLTKDTAKDCVGAGDVWTGKTITLTCTAASLPLAQFSWQTEGQDIVSSDSGVLSVQTTSTDQSGAYTCTATNTVTGSSSEQNTDLVVTDVCLDVGEVVGVVIGSFILLILLIILIILLVRFILVRRRRRELRAVPKTNPNPQPLPENPVANVVGRDLPRGPQVPPLYQANAEPRRANHMYTVPIPGRNGNGQTRNTQNNSFGSQHNGLSLANGLQHNAIQSSNNPAAHNGIDNPGFTLNELQRPMQQQQQQQMQNPNIVIQTGSAQVRLNTSNQTAQQNNNGRIPTIHVNLNSYSGDQQNAMESVAVPVASTTVEEATQTPQNARREASTLRTPMLDRHRGVLQADPGQIPTGHARNHVFNTEMEAYNQQSDPRDRSESGSTQPRPAPVRQLPWDTLRGTPSYPSGNQRRRRSESTDYTISPPLPQARSRSRERSRERQEMPRENRRPSREREMERDTRSEARSERRSPREDSRGRRGQSRGPRQEGRRDNSPQALPLMSHESPAGRASVQNQADTRALVDPNHLHSQSSQPARQDHQADQMSNRMQQGNPGANQISQVQLAQSQVNQLARQANQAEQAGNRAPQMNYPENRQTAQVHEPASPQSQLTQDALRAHTERAQTFQNRRQQTQAALLHPNGQTVRPPTLPPVMPLQQFKSLPKERTRQRDPRPPVNVPVAQRPHHHRQHGPHATTAPNHQHHQGHQQHHAGHRPTQAQGWQHQAHRGRPR